MNENRQTELRVNSIDPYEDEIELIDILRVIWKWKYLILAGTLFCALSAAIISFYMPKVYSIDMVLRPGVLTIREDGNNVYIDSEQNIKAMIEAGTFNNQVLKNINNPNSDDMPKSLKFKISIPKQSNTLKVSYDTSNIDQGLHILNDMRKLLLERYSKVVKYYQNEYAMKLDLKKAEIRKVKANKQYYENNVKNLEKRINELKSEIEIISNNTNYLVKERNKFLSKNVNENSILSALLYSNTIQQNLELANIYKNEINKYKLKREEELLKSKESENKTTMLLNEIENLEFKKNSIQNIQILQPPTSSTFPIKPKKKLIVALASTAGLFLMMFLSFFLEYISKNKSRI